MALVVKYDLFMFAADIVKAYCWSEAKQHVIIEYPTLLGREDPVTKERLYACMRRNLYGAPSSAASYTKHRDTELRKMFSINGWSIVKTKMDPNFFYLQRQGRKLWAVIYVDDCDIAAESEADARLFVETISKAWKCKETPTDFMLGVKRIKTKANGIVKVNLSMGAYVESMYHSFKEHIPERTYRTPCEPRLLLSLDDACDPAETWAETR